MRQVILAENIDRRHLTKGQRAMAVAIMYPQEMGRSAKAGKVAKNLRLSGEYVRQARMVLAHSKPLADSVLAGVKPLDVA